MAPSVRCLAELVLDEFGALVGMATQKLLRNAESLISICEEHAIQLSLLCCFYQVSVGNTSGSLLRFLPCHFYLLVLLVDGT